jgi:hypothetical protein
VARRIVHDYIHVEQSFLGVANRLNRDGIPSPTGGRWVAHVVQRLLIGKTLLGYYERNGEWHRGQHEPVIDEATWQAAQRIVERGRKYSKGGARAQVDAGGAPVHPGHAALPALRRGDAPAHAGQGRAVLRLPWQEATRQRLHVPHAEAGRR